MRIFRIDQLIKDRGPVTFEEMQNALRCSAPTLKRDLRYLREELGAPIVYQRESNGYVYAPDPEKSGSSENSSEGAAPSFVPATWYSPTEMQVLVTALQMCDTIEKARDGKIFDDMGGIKSRLMSLIDDVNMLPQDILKRVRVIAPPLRIIKSRHFEVLGNALTAKKRVQITYQAKGYGEVSERIISPLRLVWYQNRWYVDAWCHKSEKFKTFNLENIQSAVILTLAGKVMPLKSTEAELDSTYGIFSGGARRVAVIEIAPEMGVYVKDEIWHKDQRLTVHEDRSVTLEVPYADERELAGQILRLGPYAYVADPPGLRRYVADNIRQMAEVYDDEKGRKKDKSKRRKGD